MVRRGICVVVAVIVGIYSSFVLAGPAADASQLEKSAVVVTTIGTEKLRSNGVVVSSVGHILTTNHSLGSGGKFLVSTADNKRYRARVVFRSSNKDLALLKVDSDHYWPHVSLGVAPKNGKSATIFTRQLRDARKLQQRSTRVVMSQVNLYFDEAIPGMSPIVSNGMVLKSRSIKGQSGSGLYNDKQELVGIVIATTEQANKMNRTLAISAELIKPILDLEMSGHFKSDKDKARWMLDGLISSLVKSNNKSEQALQDLKEQVIEEYFIDNKHKNLTWQEKSNLVWATFLKRAKSAKQNS